jgi:hypothetical protein
MAPSIPRLILEMVIVGVSTVVLGLMISIPWMRLSAGKWPSWDIWLSTAASLFLTGAILHLIYEATGANAWYADNYS